MRCLIVAVGTNEVSTIQFLLDRVMPAGPVELIFHQELGSLNQFVHAEQTNGRFIDGIMFFIANLNYIPVAHEVMRALEQDPITAHIPVASVHETNCLEISFVDKTATLNTPMPLLDFLIRMRGSPKPPS